MWITKLKLNRKGMLFGDNASKSGCNLLGYPIAHYKKDGKPVITFATKVFGTEEQIKNFLKLMKKDKRTIRFERNNDFIIFEVLQHQSIELLFQNGIIYISPIIINNNGDYIGEIGCFNREPLAKIIESLRQFNGQLYYIKQTKLRSISFMTVMPDLTQKQKQALEMAINNDYYDYPRKIELKKLAKLMKVSYSTYHFHLRKAEKKMMYFSFNKIK